MAGKTRDAEPLDIEDQPSTFSIVAYDPENGDLGVGVQSKYFSVGPVVPWAEAGIGAVATQAFVNVSFGPRGLSLLKEGFTVEGVIEKLIEEDERRERRQLGIVDKAGNVAAYTGSECTMWAGSRQGLNFTVQGNILEGEVVLSAMVEAFESSKGELAERLVAALEAGQAVGGDARGRQSAAVLVVRYGAGRSGYGDRYVDLRVDDHKTPIVELRRLLSKHYSNGYVSRSHALLDNGKLEDALEIALRAVILSPDSDIAHLALCRAYYLNGAKTKAVEEHRLAFFLNEKITFTVNRSSRYAFILEDEVFREDKPEEE